MNKLLIALALILTATTSHAVVTSGTDTKGNKYYYSSFPMPNATWKTKIAILPYGGWQWTVAVPFYYYGDKINADIYSLRSLLIKNNIPFRDGVCTAFPYTTPCLR